MYDTIEEAEDHLKFILCTRGAKIEKQVILAYYSTLKMLQHAAAVVKVDEVRETFLYFIRLYFRNGEFATEPLTPQEKDELIEYCISGQDWSIVSRDVSTITIDEIPKLFDDRMILREQMESIQVQRGARRRRRKQKTRNKYNTTKRKKWKVVRIHT